MQFTRHVFQFFCNSYTISICFEIVVDRIIKMSRNKNVSSGCKESRDDDLFLLLWWNFSVNSFANKLFCKKIFSLCLHTFFSFNEFKKQLDCLLKIELWCHIFGDFQINIVIKIHHRTTHFSWTRWDDK